MKNGSGERTYDDGVCVKGILDLVGHSCYPNTGTCGGEEFSGYEGSPTLLLRIGSFLRGRVLHPCDSGPGGGQTDIYDLNNQFLLSQAGRFTVAFHSYGF